MLNFQTLIILRLGDIPLDDNTNSAPSCCENNNVCPDKAWVFAFGWLLCLLALAIFFISAIVELARQIDYGILNVSFKKFVHIHELKPLPPIFLHEFFIEID